VVRDREKVGNPWRRRTLNPTLIISTRRATDFDSLV